MSEVRRIFVLSPGRTATVAISRFFHYAEGWTSSHESRTGSLARDRFPYPDRHVEADNRLAWMLGHLYHHHGDATSLIVIVERDIPEIGRSYARRYLTPDGLARAWSDGIIRSGRRDEDTAADMAETVYANLALCHVLFPRVMVVQQSDLGPGLEAVWRTAAMTGDLAEAQATLGHKVNESRNSLPRNAWRLLRISALEVKRGISTVRRV